MRSIVRVAIAASLLGLGLPGVAAADQGLTKRDRQGPVTVAVTLATAPAPDLPIRARIALDTHSVGLDDLAFDQIAVLRTPGGDLAPSAVEDGKGGGHHREAVVVFPPPGGGTEVRIVVKNVGGVAERTFTWPLAPGR